VQAGNDHQRRQQQPGQPARPAGRDRAPGARSAGRRRWRRSVHGQPVDQPAKLARRHPPLSNCLLPPRQLFAAAAVTPQSTGTCCVASPSSLKGKGSPIVSCFYTPEFLVLACCQRPGCVRGQVRPAQRIPFQRPCPCRTAAIREAPGELAHYENAVGVPDSSLGLRSNATIPQAGRSPLSCTLKGVPERSAYRAMCVACVAFRVRML